jgi:hypothetical protein
VDPFSTAREEIAGKLAAAGIAATTNPRAALPCVLVGLPDSGTTSLGVGAWPAVMPVHICVPPPGDGDAAVWLLEQLTAVLVAYPSAGTDWSHGTVTHGGDDVPAYTVNIPTEIPNPNC